MLQNNPVVSQREIARELGVSLGAINYCLKALAEKGLVKIRNFRQSDNKTRYAYVLTPSGVAAKSRLARRFLERKLSEYEALRLEIREIQQEMGAPDRPDPVPAGSEGLPMGKKPL